MSSNGVKIAMGSTYLFICSLIGNFAGVVYFAFASRLLPTAAELGFVSTLGMIIQLFATFFSLSLDSAAIRYIANNIGRGLYEEAKGVFTKCYRTGLLLSLAASTVCFLFSSILASFFPEIPSSQLFFLLLTFNIFPLTLVPFANGAVQALQKFKEYALIGVTATVVKNLLCILLLVEGLGIISVLIGWLFGDWFTAAALTYLSYTSLKFKNKDQPLKPLLGYSMPLYASKMLDYLSSTLDRYVLLTFAGTALLGMYSPVIAAAGVVAMIPSAVMTTLFPKLSEIQGKGEKAPLKEAGKLASRYATLVIMPCAIGFAAIAQPLIILFVGPRYQSGAPALAIISMTIALTCINAIARPLLLATGETGKLFKSNVVAITLGVIVNLMLVPFLGLEGAAMGHASLLVTSLIINLFYLKKANYLSLDKSAYVKSVIACGIMAFGVGIIELKFNSLYYLPIYVFSGAILYVLSLKALRAIKEEDLNFAKELLPERITRLLTFFLS